MGAKISVYIAISLDGFIARTNGSLDWLDHANGRVPEGEDCGYQAFISSVDVLVMGRKTYEQVLSFGEWPYGAIRVVVLSQNPVPIPSYLSNTVTNSSEAPTKLYQRLSAEGANHLYIDGGITIQKFLAAGLVDEITITVIPVLLGEGKSLFGPLQNDMELRLLETTAFDFGFVQMKYATTQSPYC